jgi:thymidylate synthase ThyX
MDFLFDTYAEALPRVRAWVDGTFPRTDGEPEAARRRAVNAKALDLLRGLLPAASLSHMGIYATGQAYEQLILHLIGHPLPEARRYGELILAAIKAVMPSFVSRVERPDRGGAWAAYLQQRRSAAEHWAERLDLNRENEPDERPSVKLLHVDGDEDRLLAALLFEAAATPEDETLATVAELPSDERARMLADLVGERGNRRHRPGRGFEALRYRFEIVSDYGAFRDLQRHRMLTVQWQTLTPDLGAAVPDEVAAAGCGDAYRAALERSHEAYDALAAGGHAESAPYALCLGYRMRYVLDLNAREAMHLVELRSGREGHPGYRAVAHEMHAQIAEQHPAVAAAMTHVDTSAEPRLERILSEMRQERRRTAASL